MKILEYSPPSYHEPILGGNYHKMWEILTIKRDLLQAIRMSLVM